MKAVIYARYSSDSQREESIEGQLRECTEYAERNGITILRSYIDRALSARTADRPEFQNMIKDSEQKLFDVVLIWKLDRFSRDRYDSAHYKRILKKNGVKVVSVKENISDGPEGIILESMLEGYAEYYSAELSEKIQRGQKENALKCKNNGGNTPLGYVVGTDGVLAVDPLTAPLVTEIFTRYDSGESISEITASLNGRGLKTKKGKAFKIGGISLILKNRKYIGEYQYGSVIIPKGIPAIIDDDLFDRVQRRMAFNKKAPVSGTDKETMIVRYTDFAEKASKQSSEREVLAVQIERKAEDYYKAEYARRHLGECYEGIISGVTQRGIFVELENGVEGFVPASSLTATGTTLTEGIRLSDPASGKTWSLGDSMMITIVRADINLGKVDFEVAPETK